MQIPSSLSHPSALVGEASSRAGGPAQPAGREEQSPAVKLELSPLARRSSFPPASDLKELAAGLEPKHRALQLAAALDGPGVPVALKLSTLKMMLAGATAPLPYAPEEGPTSSVESRRGAQDAPESDGGPPATSRGDDTSNANVGHEAFADPRPIETRVAVAPDAPATTAGARFSPSPAQPAFETEA